MFNAHFVNNIGQSEKNFAESDSTFKTTNDTISSVSDSTVAIIDSNQQSTSTYRLSPDSIDAPVDYNAEDSIIYDIAKQVVHLYGNAEVNHKTINLKADYIEFDWKANEVRAKGVIDSTGEEKGRPVFFLGDRKSVV